MIKRSKTVIKQLKEILPEYEWKNNYHCSSWTGKKDGDEISVMSAGVCKTEINGVEVNYLIYRGYDCIGGLVIDQKEVFK